MYTYGIVNTIFVEIQPDSTNIKNDPRTVNHLNMKLIIFVEIIQVLKNEFLKFRILEILNFYP